MYEFKFKPGKHYHIAHMAIYHDKIGILASKNGEFVASGTLSKKQVERLSQENLEKYEEDYVVDYETYEKLHSEFKEEKDKYIIENNIPIDAA